MSLYFLTSDMIDICLVHLNLRVNKKIIFKVIKSLYMDFKYYFISTEIWINKWKIDISIVFFHDLSENQLHFLEKWVIKKLWAFEVIYSLCVC